MTADARTYEYKGVDTFSINDSALVLLNFQT